MKNLSSEEVASVIVGLAVLDGRFDWKKLSDDRYYTEMSIFYRLCDLYMKEVPAMNNDEAQRLHDFISAIVTYRFLHIMTKYYMLWTKEAMEPLFADGVVQLMDYRVDYVHWHSLLIEQFNEIDKKYAGNYRYAIKDIALLCSSATGFKCTQEMIPYLMEEAVSFENKMAEAVALLTKAIPKKYIVKDPEDEKPGSSLPMIVQLAIMCFVIYGIYKFIFH